MSIVLLEPSNSGKTRKSSTDLVSMENSEVSHSQRKFSVRSNRAVEHEAVTRAVHGLHSEALILDLEQEDVVLIVFVMTTGLPELQVVHIGRNNFFVASNLVLVSHEFN